MAKKKAKISVENKNPKEMTNGDSDSFISNENSPSGSHQENSVDDAHRAALDAIRSAAHSFALFDDHPGSEGETTEESYNVHQPHEHSMASSEQDNENQLSEKSDVKMDVLNGEEFPVTESENYLMDFQVQEESGLKNQEDSISESEEMDHDDSEVVGLNQEETIHEEHNHEEHNHQEHNHEDSSYELQGVPSEASFLPEASAQDEAELDNEGLLVDVESVEGTELDEYESASIEETEFVEEERLESILESIFFASDRPVSMNSLKMVFKGTNIRGDKIKKAIERLSVELASGRRGITLEEVPGGYQMRTKYDNLQFITRTLKARQFKLSGPALEVLAIVAYKQPVVKHEIDEIRGVESGHLLRALMEKGLVSFEGKSDLPGRPMNYATTKKFLEIFGLRNLKELPTLSQIDEILPEGMTEEEAKPTLGDVSDSLAQTIGNSYSEGEDELMKISDQLDSITTSSDFFEQEKLRQKQKRDADKAQTIREAILVGEAVSNRDKNWLEKYDLALQAGEAAQFSQNQNQEDSVISGAISHEVTDENKNEIGFLGEGDLDQEAASFDRSEEASDEDELEHELAHFEIADIDDDGSDSEANL